ncbi:MAG: rhomboid family intramembrane serine protease, partial [Cytophagaceae bacterium]
SLKIVNKLYGQQVDQPMVGASGAIFGVLMAFGLLFPNTELFLLFPPIPIKAKYFVIFYGALEIYSGLYQQAGDNVAHFAHIGGMLFAYILVKYWNSQRKTFY